MAQPPTNPPNHALGRFQELLKELFRFDCADLDFGIYRILNHNRNAIATFIDTELPEAVEEALASAASIANEEAAARLASARTSIVENLGLNALTSDGHLISEYRASPLGQRYIEAQRRAATIHSTDALATQVLNHLYAFFSRYYDSGDFTSKRRYSQQSPYAIPHNGQEVLLHWANADQYYVKTTDHFHDYDFRTTSGIRIHFKLRSVDVQRHPGKSDKRFFIAAADDATWHPHAQRFTVPFHYRTLTASEKDTLGRTSDARQKFLFDAALSGIRRAAEIHDSLADSLAGPPLTGTAPDCLTHHLRQYIQRNTADLFIHKDLRGFLSRELDFYIKTAVIDLNTVPATRGDPGPTWLRQVPAIRSVGDAIIAHLSAIEDVQRRLWEKRPFILDTQYCLTLDLVPDVMLRDVAANRAQWEEWKTLLRADQLLGAHTDTGDGEPPTLSLDFLRANPHLVLDTRHFCSEFVDRLLTELSTREPLPDRLDGTLMHGDNFRALSLLQPTYRGAVRACYIDPPYNTGSDDFVYRDALRHSSWMTMLYDRLLLARSLAHPLSAIFISIDQNEQPRLSALMDLTWGSDNYVAEIVWAAGRKNDSRLISLSHEYILAYARDHADMRRAHVKWRERKSGLDDIYKQYARLRQVHGQDHAAVERKLKSWYKALDDSEPAKRHRHYSSVDARGIFFPSDISWPGGGGPRYDVLHPTTGRPVTVPARGWKTEDRGRMAEWIQQDLVQFGTDERTRPTFKTYLRDSEFQVPYSVFYRDGRAATKRLRSILGSNAFPHPKDDGVVANLIGMSTSPGDLIVDFFAGSGTTGHAVMNLARLGPSSRRRKIILVEVANSFEAVLLPRLKKVAYAPDWKDGCPTNRGSGMSWFMKYLRLESYEDVLNNLTARSDASVLPARGTARYTLAHGTGSGNTLLTVERLERPFSYSLDVQRDGVTERRTADLPETFNFLIGLLVRTRRVCYRDGRRVLVVRGETREGRETVVVWRDIAGWAPDEFDREREWVREQGFTEGAEAIYVNGDSVIDGAESLDPVFKERMFAPIPT